MNVKDNTQIGASFNSRFNIQNSRRETRNNLIIIKNNHEKSNLKDSACVDTRADRYVSGALVGASVTIAGTNFDATPANNTVKFNGTAATVTTATTTQLVVTVPAGTTNGKITVTTTSGTATSASDFILALPTVASFSPTSGAVGVTVQITGTNFSTTLANNVVKFNGTAATVTAATATLLTVTVPVGATSGKITVGAVNSSSDFTVSASITSISSATGAIGKAIIITGLNFDATAGNNVVTINGTAAIVTAATTTQLTTEVPYGAASTGKLSLSVNNQTAVTKDFQVVSAWAQKADVPVVSYGGTTFTINQFGYYGNAYVDPNGVGGPNSIYNQTLHLYAYNQSTNNWAPLNDCPTLFGTFTIGNIIYGQATNGLWFTYNQANDTWTNGGDVMIGIGSAFGIGQKAYYVNGTTTYEFDPAANSGQGQWTALPALLYKYPSSNIGYANYFVVNGSAYYGGGPVNGVEINNFYKLTPGTGWVSLSNLPAASGAPHLFFANGQYGYVLIGTQFWRYDPATDNWRRLEDLTFTVSKVSTFNIGTKSYITIGILNQFWEYDPSK